MISSADHPLAHIGIPVPLLYSRCHSALSVAAYAKVAALTPYGRNARPFAESREFVAAQLGVSVSGLAKALQALSVEHARPGPFGRHPVYLTTGRRGDRMTAERKVMPSMPASAVVKVPAWSLGRSKAGPLVSWRAWRLYAVLYHKRYDDETCRGACRLPARELGEQLGMRRESVAGLFGELERAGLVVAVRRPGQPAVVVPLMLQTEDHGRAKIAEQMAEVLGSVAERRL